MDNPQADSDAPPLAAEAVLDRALTLVEFLRASCPWDAAQTPTTLRRYLLEEAHEVVEAIDRGDDLALQDELGDLLLNVAFQMVLGEERGAFTRGEVVRTLEEKMRRRHPHLYGGEPEPWEVLKGRERSPHRDGTLGGVPLYADPLQRAQKIQERVAEVGFDWTNPRGAWEKIREEVEEVGVEMEGAEASVLEEELGDLLFAVVNLVRMKGLHATTALGRANAKFTRRFGELEQIAAARGIVLEDAGLEALDRLWDEVKRAER